MVFESFGFLFFFVLSLLSRSLHDFHAHLFFHSHFIFTAHTSLGCRMSEIASQTNCCHRPYTAHVILKVREEDAVNDVLFASLSNYRERASRLIGISNKTIWRIKADSENAVLVPPKP